MLDLNNPLHARYYIQTWIDRGDLVMGSVDAPLALEEGTDYEVLCVAKQLFLQHDPRETVGSQKDPL